MSIFVYFSLFTLFFAFCCYLFGIMREIVTPSICVFLSSFLVYWIYSRNAPGSTEISRSDVIRKVWKRKGKEHACSRIGMGRKNVPCSPESVSNTAAFNRRYQISKNWTDWLSIDELILLVTDLKRYIEHVLTLESDRYLTNFDRMPPLLQTSCT